MIAGSRSEIALDAFKKACLLVLPSLIEQDFDLITPHLSSKTYNKGALILIENQVCDKIFFLNAGFVRMYYLDESGNQINYRFTSSGNFFVDFQSFLTNRPSRFYWEAMQKSEILMISYEAVQDTYKRSSTWNVFGRIIAEQVYLQLNERVEMLLFMQPEERYLHMLAKYPYLLSQVPQLHIASYLGMKPETLSRVRKRISRR